MAAAYPFLYAAPRTYANRPINTAVYRDPVASCDLRLALFEHGYEFGEPILNFPTTDYAFFERLPFDRLRSLDLPFLGSGDLLVQATRPPIHDGTYGDRKKIEPGNCREEYAIIEVFRRYFTTCARSYIELTPEAASFLKPGKESHGSMEFYQERAEYKYLQALGGKRSVRRPLGERTAAFLLRLDALWEDGPGLVAAFGMNALATLAWCRLLRRRYSGLLENRGLTIVELLPRTVPSSPMTHEWTSDWHAEILLETGVELPARPAQRAVTGRRPAIAL